MADPTTPLVMPAAPAPNATVPAATAVPATPAAVTAHDRVQKVQYYLLDVLARAQAEAAPNITMSLATVQAVSQALTLALIAMEGT